MKRLLLAFFLLAATGLFLYACSSDDSLAPGGDGGFDTSDGSVKDGQAGDGSVTDGGEGDAALNDTSLQIQAVKNAGPLDSGAADDGGLAVNLPIDNATVTYVRPAVGSDPAGFFLQAQKTGPAIFVAIDPSTLSPAPVPGDNVSMTVTTIANVVSLHEIIGVSGWTRNSQGNSIAALLRDVSSATDLSSKINNYESEYIKIDGFIASAFGGSSAGSVSAEVTTAGVTSPASSLKIRLPVTVQTDLDPELTCTFSLTGVMWRFANNAEPSGYVDGDLSVTCAAPQVTGAVATSLTTVNVTFDRNIAGSSVMSNGSQFTIVDGADAGVGVAVSNAALTDPRTVTLTTTSQTQGQAYTLSVATSVTDVLSKPLDAAHATANFVGYLVPAEVRLNELNPNISGKDLIELQVLADGDLLGMSLRENLVSSKVLLAVLPRLHVTAGDLVVVHLNADLSDGGPSTIINETTGKGECTDVMCYPNAWDVKDTSSPPSKDGMVYSAKVIVVKRPDGSLADAISWWRNNGSTTPSSTFYQETNALIDAGMWVSCGGGYCNDTDAATAISVNSNGSGSSRSGASVQRYNDTDTNGPGDWIIDAGSFGDANF